MTSPLPIAIAANLGSAGAVSVLAGSLISYLISNTMLDNLPLLFALVVVVCLRVMKRPAKTSAGIACSTGLCVFFSGIVVSLLFHASGAEVIGYTMTAALTGCAPTLCTLSLPASVLPERSRCVPQTAVPRRWF